MKIKLSRIILLVSVIGMVLASISLFNIHKVDIVVNDVYGERSVLGDMNILVQQTKGLLETDSIIINKDGESINKFIKQGAELVNLTKENIDNRDVFQFEYDENLLFEDEDKIGIANVLASNIVNDTKRMTADIKIKDKESGKIESYEIDMGEALNINKDYIYATLPVKKEGDILYIAVMYSYYNNSSNEEYVDDLELEDKNCEITNLSLYKLNLENKTSKCIINTDYEGNELSLKKSAFSNGNKAYFVVAKKDNKSEIYVTNLFEFDIKNKEVNLIDLGTKDDYIKNVSTIETDEVLLMSIPVEDALYGRETKNPKTILLDLKNRKLKNAYKLSMNYDVNPLTSENRIIRYDGKIYAVSREYVKKYETNYSIPTFYVFDETNGEKLYEGNVEINSNYRVNMGIVKNDEI